MCSTRIDEILADDIELNGCSGSEAAITTLTRLSSAIRLRSDFK
jgi:hypothetical protein